MMTMTTTMMTTMMTTMTTTMMTMMMIILFAIMYTVSMALTTCAKRKVAANARKIIAQNQMMTTMMMTTMMMMTMMTTMTMTMMMIILGAKRYLVKIMILARKRVAANARRVIVRCHQMKMRRTS